MTLNIYTFLIVCPLLFLAGLVDAIGGGGGLISLPAYLLAGVPVHNAIATNKLSSACGTTLATVRFIREGLVNWKLALPTIVFAVAGSSLGANASMATSDGIMEKILFVILPVVAFVVLNPKATVCVLHLLLHFALVGVYLGCNALVAQLADKAHRCNLLCITEVCEEYLC